KRRSLVKAVVKLRRAPSDAPRPASTPPVISATAVCDEDDEDKILAELESASSAPGPAKGPQPTVAARLKNLQQGSLERPNKTRKQKEDFSSKTPGQQQVFHF
ncbi:hypothetical protein CRUP_013922, partial [Coryphaenoides rupestris]